MSAPKVRMVCKTCGGLDVRLDATAEWDALNALILVRKIMDKL